MNHFSQGISAWVLGFNYAELLSWCKKIVRKELNLFHTINSVYTRSQPTLLEANECRQLNNVTKNNMPTLDMNNESKARSVERQEIIRKKHS